MTVRKPIITRAGEGLAHGHAGGARSFSALTSDQNPGGIAVQMGEMPEGSGPPFHRHPAFDEVFIILEGVVEFQVESEVHTARAGDLVFVPGELPHAPHCVEGNADGVAKIIMLVTPARFEDFFHELGKLVDQGDASHDSIAKLGETYGIEFLERPKVTTRHN